MKIATTLDLFLPIHFLKDAISLVESDPHSNQKWQGQTGTSTGSSCFIVTCGKASAKTELLSISVKNVRFKVTDSRLTCQITETEKSIDTEEPLEKENVNQLTTHNDKQEEQSGEQIPKRKRGRKRKSDIAQSQPGNNALNFEKTEETGRYSLRGVKIPENIMRAVKGIDYNIHGGEITPLKKELMESKLELNSLHEIDNEGKIVQVNSEICSDDKNMEIGYMSEEDAYANNSEGDDDFVLSDEEFVMQKRRKRKKLFNTKHTDNTTRPRKNRKIDLGDIPKFERRKPKLERNASCKYCDKLFADYTGVDLHVKKYHTKEKGFKEYVTELIPLKIMTCETCGENFPDRILLQDHENRNHRRTAAAKCFRCNKMYKNINSLRNHVRSVHFVKGQPNLCHLCPAKFKWRVTLRQHIEEIHEGKLNSVCKVCGKKFARDSLLKRHQRIHGVDQSKRLVCNKCGKGFWYDCNLQRHLQCVHGDQQESFHCSYCGKGFNNKYGMMTHVQQVHFNLYPFKCPNCNSGFTSKKLLKYHLAKVHNLTNVSVHAHDRTRFKYGRKTEDLFFCSYCSTSFCYKAKLVDHMHTTHAEAFPYKCNHCNQGFLERSFLVHHLQKAHNEEVDESIVVKEEVVESSIVSIDTSNIAKLVTLNIGPGNKEVYTIENTKPKEQGEQTDSLTAEEPEGEVIQSDNAEKSSSVLFEVSTGDGTIQYVIKQPEDGRPAVLPKELADLLLAAESVENYEASVQTEESQNNSTETVTFLSSDVDEHVQIVSCDTTVEEKSDAVFEQTNLYNISEDSSKDVIHEHAVSGHVNIQGQVNNTDNTHAVKVDKRSRKIVIDEATVNKDNIELKLENTESE